MEAPGNNVCERRDSITLERWDLDTRIYQRFDSGKLVIERPFTPAEVSWANSMTSERQAGDNLAGILARARVAYNNNLAYLAAVEGGTATNADHIAQVPRLTRQMQEVIRWIVRADLLG